VHEYRARFRDQLPPIPPPASPSHRVRGGGRDFIVAQGIEAGGHVCGTIGLLPLLGEMLGAVPLPVLAVGGMGAGRAMAAGADGVRVGTRFVATEEAGTHGHISKRSSRTLALLELPRRTSRCAKGS
jgi:NAD(P)H-dependent flavin oxidoreductase YrpB (nitropropane dioxygenase family)